MGFREHQPNYTNFIGTKGYVPKSNKEIDGAIQDSGKVGNKGGEELSSKKIEIVEEDDGEWYMGRAKEEHRQRMKNAERRARGEDVGVSEVCSDQTQFSFQ